MKTATKVWMGISVFILLVYLTSGDTRLTVTQYYPNGTVISTEEYKQLNAQSMFGNVYDLMLQSAEPASPGTYSVFKARVDNPFPGEAKLVEALVYKNGVLIEEKKFDQTMQKSYAFTTDKIDMEGVSTKRNDITIKFTIEFEGEKQIQQFEYNYMYLEKCVSDGDCAEVEDRCDRGNMARFSKGDYFYCVKTCASNDQCYTGQVCLHGFCGY